MCGLLASIITGKCLKPTASDVSHRKYMTPIVQYDVYLAYTNILACVYL